MLSLRHTVQKICEQYQAGGSRSVALLLPLGWRCRLEKGAMGFSLLAAPVFIVL